MNDDNAADAPRTVHVCPGCGSRDVHITAWIDCNTSRVLGDEGPLDVDLVGGSWCPVCESDDQGLTQVPYCEDCDGKGWEVFECGFVHVVQRCDTCARLDSDDAAAGVAFGAGLVLAPSGEVTPADESEWRARYPVICPGASS